jgi:hypothetical protein
MNRCTIVMSVDPASEPIAGTVGDGSGEESEFIGYAHLVAAIERHLESARSDEPRDDGRGL